MAERENPSSHEIEDAYKDATRLRARQRRTEIFIWLFLSGFVSIPYWMEWLGPAGGNFIDLTEVISNRSFSFFGSLLVAIFPVLFLQIFGDLPLSVLRRMITARPSPSALHVDATGGDVHIGSINMNDPSTVASAIETRTSVEALRGLNSRDLLGLYAERTSDLTKKIYSRAGVYLMVGVMISFVGLAFFYVRSRELPDALSLADRALSLLPGFGILFFIEFIAFFFLRQYRSAMDEFRYFDAIRRSREENLVILKMFSECESPIPTKEILGTMQMYSSAGKLAKGETTEILETRRMQKDEALMFEKLLDVIAQFRATSKRGENGQASEESVK